MKLLSAALGLAFAAAVLPSGEQAALDNTLETLGSPVHEMSEHVDSVDGQLEDASFMNSLFMEMGTDLASLENGVVAVDEATDLSFVEVDSQAEKVHGYCEICVRMVQMYQRGLPDVCSGLTDTYFISVSHVARSSTDPNQVLQ
jgi:hypothetical protein